MILNSLLQPMLALAGWTMVVWTWMYATRLPAMSRAGIDGTKLVGSTGKSLRDQLIAAGEERACWVADNYNHLLEQPTIYYAVVLAIVMVGSSDTAVQLAWAYTGLRIAHSLVQILSNRVVVRFALFALSSLCLIGLVVLALSEAF